MPLIRYKCNECGEDFKLIEGGINEKKECPHCNSEDIEKTIGQGVSLRFKGDGFYRTDYKGENNG